MRISILSPDLSSNCLGRAYTLARLAQREHEVEVVGPASRGGIWEPLASQREVTLKTLSRFPSFSESLLQARALRQAITGDVIYASKPLFTSYGFGLIRRLAEEKPLVLDIDDWQLGLQYEALARRSILGLTRKLVGDLLRFGASSSYWNCLVFENLVGLADDVTVSGSFLRQRFGGTIIWHARDTHTLNPCTVKGQAVRNLLEVDESKRLILFVGTPRPHKGLEDLVEAVACMHNDRIVLAMVGVGQNPYSRALEASVRRELSDREVRLLPPQSYSSLPVFLASADVVVIPQRSNHATEAQVPAKVFDAMAMAKPIVATRVSDLPEILEGCGWLVDPDRPEQLAAAISYVIRHPNEARDIGWKARQKCIREYSYDAMAPVLTGMLSHWG